MKRKIELMKADMKKQEKQEMAFALAFFGLSIVVSLLLGLVRFLA